MFIYYHQCPICGNQDLLPFLTCKDYTVSKEDFAIIYCQQCQTGITQNIPNQSTISKYYQSESYISHSDTKKGLVNQLYHSARRLMLQSKYQLIKKLTRLERGKILDIGSGTGYFLQTMQKKQWEVVGIEAEEKARQFSQEQFGLTVFSPEEIKNISEKQFDVITLWHVLEHLHDLHGTWEHLKRLLTTEGVLLIAVPNHQSYDAKHYQQYWAAYDVPRHLWHFSPKSLKILAHQHGFQIIDQKMMPFDPFYIALISEKYKTNSLGFIKGLWHGSIAFLAGLLEVKRSSSVIYVLKNIN
jgi:2-polyprenyl-3-methyl-5-hydroxy-6-metoxy-1,4-benzoquinol methylase